MVKKCYVRWPGNDRYSGPYEVEEYSRDEYVNILLGDKYGDWIRTIPPDWTLGVDDGWTVWESGECPVGRDTVVQVVYRSGALPAHGSAAEQRWHHNGGAWDIIAYRGVDDGWRDWTPGEGQPDETRGKLGCWDYESTEVNFDLLRWDLLVSIHRYKITGDAEPEQVPLSTIMDRQLWWLDDGLWYAVDRYDPDDDVDAFSLTDGTCVSRDWFTGREHKRGEEFDD